MKTGTIITIDGPSGVGKSTAARAVAERLGYTYLDTGAMYRAVALQVSRSSVDINDEFSLRNLLEHMAISFVRGDGYDMRICANGEDVTDRIRTREIGLLSSNVAKKAVVRKKLVDIQRKAGDKGDIVAEGRDMGTYVFPQADFKFYLDADIEQRAARRWKELKLSGTETTLAEIKTDIERRDKQDMERAESPLHPAPNAVIIDTTDLEVHEVVGAILNEVESGRLLGSE